MRALRLTAEAAGVLDTARVVLAESREVLSRARNTMQTSVNRRALRKLESKKK
jgi:hypothetical protein